VPAIRTSPIVALAAAGTAEDTWLDTLGGWLADPRVAFLLLAIGIVAIMAELAHPGTVGTGVGGAAAVLVGLWSLSMQSMDAVGLGLIVLAAVLYALELFNPTTGVAAAFGSIALFVGGLLLIDGPGGGVPVAVVAPTAVVLGVAVVAAGRIGLRTRHLPSTLTGTGRFVGRDLTVASTDGATGRAFVEGAWWSLRSTGPVLATGAPARVVAVEGLVLIVDPRAPLEEESPWR
jgi:membrane-bound serine protease (ClpP class)